MKITVLGSGTLSPSVRRTAAGILIEHENDLILLDSGSGIYYKLALAGIDFHEILYLFYSHYEHPDHINDLPYILFAKKYESRENKKDIAVTGPRGFISFYNKIKTLYPVLEELPFKANITEMHNEKLIYDNFIIESKQMSHGSADANGYRIESSDKSITYSGDTDYCENIVELANGTDLLITECSYPDQLKIPNHLSPGIAGKIASEAGAKKLLLTHFYPQCDEYDILKQAEMNFSGEIILAEDMMQIEI